MLNQQRPRSLFDELIATVTTWVRWGRELLHASTDEELRRWRQAGHISVIVLNSLLLIVAHSLPGWSLPLITAAWTEVLWAIDLSLIGSLLAHALFMAYDPPWFRDLGEIVITGLALVAWTTLLRVFPFDFGSRATDSLAHLIGTIVVIAIGIALLTQIITWLVRRLRDLLA